jgi:hypothetical protein
MLPHEEFQLVIKQLAVPDSIHHFSFLEELQPPSPPPAEAVPLHHLLQVLHGLPGELRGKVVQPLGLLQWVFWLPDLSSKWLSSEKITLFQFSNPQFTCSLANASLCSLIRSSYNGEIPSQTAIYKLCNRGVFITRRKIFNFLNRPRLLVVTVVGCMGCIRLHAVMGRFSVMR